MRSGTMIARINTYSKPRVVEVYYNDISEINTKEYNLDKVIACCEGKIATYGGKYSVDGLIWRYVNDFPYLDSDYEFFSKGPFNMNVAYASNSKRTSNADMDRSTLDWSMAANKISDSSSNKDAKSSEEMLDFMRYNSFCNRDPYTTNPFPYGIVQIDANTGVAVRVYPSISHIPNNIFKHESVEKCLSDGNKSLHGYKFMRYGSFYSYFKESMSEFEKLVYTVNVTGGDSI